MPNTEPENQVLITYRNGYIHILNPDNFVITPDKIEGLWENLTEACTKYDCNRVLNEGSVDLSKLRAYDSYHSGAQAGEIQGLRMAFLFHGYTPDERADFFKTVASNRGAKIEFFSDRRAALRWLGVSEIE
ncbi:MAG TPA: hypothetical protein VIL74_20945 [Pyrinomonadaceae bacterium]|jgi:hypothetical protein